MGGWSVHVLYGVTVTVCSVVLSAQPAWTVRGAFLQTWHSAELRSAAGIIDCGTFRSGSSSGWSVAAGVELPLSPLRLELTLMASQLRGALTTHNTFPFRDTVSGSVIEVTTEPRLQNSWLIGEFQPAVQAVFGKRFRTIAGLRIGTPLAARFRQEERILNPDTVFFLLPEGRRVRSRVVAEGELRQQNRLLLGMFVGFEHATRIARGWQWLQRVGVEYTLSSLLHEAPWRLWELRAEVGLRMELPTSADTIPLPPLSPAPQPVAEEPPRVFHPGLALQVLDVTARIRSGLELLATPPVVPAVFFAQNSAEIPERYRRTPLGELELVELDPLTAHQFILPYVAVLARRNPRSRIVVEGATSGEDEPGGLQLAQQRAEAVRQALIELGVPIGRIVARWSLLPRSLSNLAYAAGREENRRVDISVLDAPTIEYTQRQRFRELVGALALRIACRDIPADQRVELYVSCSDTLSLLPCLSDTVVQLPVHCRLPVSAPAAESLPLSVRGAVPQLGVAADAHAELVPAVYPHDTVVLDLRRFRAILRFEYNSAQLLPEVQDRLRQLVALVPPSTSVIIYGSTDALGTEQRNIELTEERAQRTAAFLRSLSPSLRIRTAALPPERKFPEHLPEGRFLNRSIWIEVEP